MTILLTGGGSGGHITPVLAVASELEKLVPDAKLIYVGQRGDSLGDVASSHASIDASYAVSAGKLRRYHKAGIGQLFDVKTHLLNIRDVFRTIRGVFQCIRLLKRLRPDVIFIKGGFVGVPVGLAAAMLKIPYITHDSDVLPGLANRIVAPWAAAHAVALPKEAYKYPPSKTYTVGVPISSEYQYVDAASRLAARSKRGLASSDKVLLVTGGGLGAQRLNIAVAAGLGRLFKSYPTLAVIHLAGRANETEMQKYYQTHLTAEQFARVKVFGFSNDVAGLSAAADVVIARAGGTFIAEFAAQGKACIVIPNPYLTGGHQLQNARILEQQGSVKVVPENMLPPMSDLLERSINELMDDEQLRKQMGDVLHQNAVLDSAQQLAKILLANAKSQK